MGDILLQNQIKLVISFPIIHTTKRRQEDKKFYHEQVWVQGMMDEFGYLIWHDTCGFGTTPRLFMPLKVAPAIMNEAAV